MPFVFVVTIPNLMDTRPFQIWQFQQTTDG